MPQMPARRVTQLFVASFLGYLVCCTVLLAGASASIHLCKVLPDAQHFAAGLFMCCHKG
jgi:hypothetical protein